MSVTPDRILEAAAQTFAERNKEYRNNWRMVGPVMKEMFPDGIDLATMQEQERFHLFSLIVVKLTRYAVNFHNGGHKDSIHDIAVYAAMLESIDDETAD